jgi:hypothetical protein
VLPPVVVVVSIAALPPVASTALPPVLSAAVVADRLDEPPVVLDVVDAIVIEDMPATPGAASAS